MSPAAEELPDAGIIHSPAPASGPGSDVTVGAHRICRAAAWTSKGPWVANPTCACTSRTQGAPRCSHRRIYELYVWGMLRDPRKNCGSYFRVESRLVLVTVVDGIIACPAPKVKTRW